MIPYAELHLHTDRSILDGVSTPEEYMIRAHEIGIGFLACTDHSTCAAHRDFLRVATEHGIKAGLGVELHFTDDRFNKTSKAKRQEGEDSEIYYHLIAIAKNDNGLKNIYAMEREAWLSGFYSKPRVDKELLEKYHEDIIITTACVSGPVGRNLINGNEEKALEWLYWFKDIFADDLYMELQYHNEAISPGLNHRLLELADANGIKPVATSDCHHADPKDLWLQEALLILNTNPKKAKDYTLADKMDYLEKYNVIYPDRKMTFEHADVHLSNADEKFGRFAKQGITRTDIYTNTIEVANKIG